MKKYATAVVLACSVLLAGCSGNSSRPESSETDKLPTTDVILSTEPAAPTEENSVPQTTPEQTQADDETTVPQAETTVPENPGGYIADWIYGTWSVISVNGVDFWAYADANEIYGERQMAFDKDSCTITSGEGGLDWEFTYAITDGGAVIYDEDGSEWAELTYDPSADTLTFATGGETVVMRRGENPRQGNQQGLQSDGMTYIADWIYGTWSAISVNGQEFWQYADENGISGEYILNFTAQGVDVIEGDELRSTLAYRITDAGAEITDASGNAVPLTYDPSADALTVTDSGETAVLKRGNNPRPADFEQ